MNKKYILHFGIKLNFNFLILVFTDRRTLQFLEMKCNPTKKETLRPKRERFFDFRELIS